MQREPLHQAKHYIKQKRQHRAWNRIVAVLICVVVFVTTYMLILPAITMEQTAYCGFEEHKHSAACFEKRLVCELEEDTPHIHSEACYQEQQILVCNQEESAGHSHDEKCVQSAQILICTEDHDHADSCYKSEEIYVCGMTEGENAHTHSSACYETREVLVCGQEEGGSGHVHTDACYQDDLICQKEEHEHTLACFSNPKADIETKAVWEKTMSNVSLTGVWADDIISIAKSQLGYKESTKNYIIADNGRMKGYTRYGEWYGNAYGDWCAMFASFCISYAGVEDFPISANCRNWIEQLSTEEYEAYFERNEYTPEHGDLVFFNTDGKEGADHVGIVAEIIEETDTEPAQLKTIEGNSADRVQYVTYDLEDERIMGYGQIPENPELSERKHEVVLSAITKEGICINLSGAKSSFPYPAEELTVTAETISNESAEELVDAAVTNTELENGKLYLFDVRLWHDGIEIQPTGPVSLTFEGSVFSERNEIAGVFHVDEQKEQVTSMNTTLTEDGSIVVETDHFSIYGVIVAGGGNVTISQNITVAWDETQRTITSLFFNAVSTTTDKVVYRVEYSDDGGTTWITETTSGTTGKGATAVLDASGAIIDAPINRLYRIYGAKDKNNYGYTASVTLDEILDSVKAGFSDWLKNNYIQDFGGSSLPTTQAELFDVFAYYNSLPALDIATRLESGSMWIDAQTDGAGTYSYLWEYQDEDGNWQQLCEDTSQSICASSIDLLLDGGKNVRCKLDEDGQLRAISNILFVNPMREAYDAAIAEINSGLNLGNLEIGGKAFNDYFYYGNVAKDSRVPFNDAAEYADYLAKVYLNAGGGNAGLDAVAEKWDYYLYDLYDPTSKSNTSDYPAYTYGDTNLEWPKDSTPSFHGSLSPQVDQLNYDFLENGVDYGNFVSDLDKTVTAVAPGDDNTDRKYLVDLTADAQAKAVGPVAMILQIQTSWQMFDLEHANALVGQGATSRGAASNNTELANLYDIKHALLRFVDYMESHYPGNNLVLGITEVQHAKSQTMFSGQDANGKELYVTNNYNILKQSILDWDSFGNCEHVHYDTDQLKNATSALSSNLKGWEDFYGREIQYEDIQKVAVVIGGPTENNTGDDGYGCTLPWSTFRSEGLNSVYGIRTNNGTSLNSAGIISWLDNTANNTGSAFIDAVGTTFTEKYVATTEDAVFNYLVQIAETEMRKKGIEITATDKYVDDVTVSDTISDELFVLDDNEPIIATVYNKDGSVDTQMEISLDDPNLTITHNPDGTTTVTYNFGRVYNTKKCALHFGIQANEDYIGSNNVYSNVGTPVTTYVHEKIDEDGNPTGVIENYTVNCKDTPQVNVPIRFKTTDGETVNIIVGDKVDLADLSPAIVEHAESLIDNYDQINGTLSYVWVLPDGSEVDAGSVTVVDGSIGAQSLPSREYEFTGESAGQYVCTLKVTFTPEPVDATSKNFSNEQTAEPVGALTKEGNVWINVVAEDSTERFIVRKIWEGDPPSETASLSFRILANGIPVTGEDGEELLYSLDAANNWETEVSGLPCVVDGEIQEYSVEEYPVPEGYYAEYSTATQQDDDLAAKAILIFTPSSNQDNKTLKLTCRYNGQEYTYITPKGSYKNNQRYSFTVDNLPLGEDGEPFECEIVSVIRVDDGKSVTLSYSDVSTEKYVRGTSVLQVKVITNHQAYELPQSGGSGTLLITLSGLCLMLSALLYRYHARRMQERRTDK